ncbi:swi5-like zinc finger protein [Coemansia guatemalensis]|uniref:Swi5-like zinc finger protein n=1 Tax=Coemansia guatemalensis TaxID=2761395 RepID=A0A9W8HYL6_9FUNG|nr:swi5-like zinc finger protein [Coemansia guatemalensis]
MDASPSKRTTAANGKGSSLLPDSRDDSGQDEQPLFATTLEDEHKQELKTGIGKLKQELESQTQARDALLKRAGMSIEQARQLNDEHIERLHRYNDIKDAAQILFGKLAELKGKTVKEIYEEHGVDLAD